MKIVKKLAFLTVTSVLVLSSCSIDKRLYNSGYSVEWKSKGKKAAKNENNNTTAQVVEATNLTPVESTKAENTVIGLGELKNNTVLKNDVVAQVSTSKAVSSKMAVKASKGSNLSSKIASKVIAKKIENSTRGKSGSNSNVPIVVLYILCCLLPFLAVGLATDWDGNTVLINILLTLLCGIPGIIHAIIVVSQEA